jgi:hypothetical protein
MRSSFFEMNELIATLPTDQPGRQAQPDHRVRNSSVQRLAVIIIAPPWPRSGTARVIQNQMDHYRHRWFRTFCVGVPFHWAYMKTSPIWDDITEGIQDLGANQAFIAALELR